MAPGFDSEAGHRVQGFQTQHDSDLKGAIMDTSTRCDSQLLGPILQGHGETKPSTSYRNDPSNNRSLHGWKRRFRRRSTVIHGIHGFHTEGLTVLHFNIRHALPLPLGRKFRQCSDSVATTLSQCLSQHCGNNCDNRCHSVAAKIATTFAATLSQSLRLYCQHLRAMVPPSLNTSGH